MEEKKKKCFHWKIYGEEQSSALGQPPRMEPHEHTESALGGSCQTFYVFLLCLIKRLGEDQPCQIKNGKVGLAYTGHGCPSQGLLGLLGNCRFIEISLEWVQMQVRPSCWQTIAKVMQMSPANGQFPGVGSSMGALQASFCRGAVEIFFVSGVWTKMYFTFFATFDCYIDACFMARWRITVPCSKLTCPSGPSINSIARISTI